MHYQSESTEAYGCHLDTQEPYLWKLFCVLTFESEVVSLKVFILQGIISPECSLWVRGGGREEHVQASGVACTQKLLDGRHYRDYLFSHPHFADGLTGAQREVSCMKSQ